MSVATVGDPEAMYGRGLAEIHRPPGLGTMVGGGTGTCTERRIGVPVDRLGRESLTPLVDLDGRLVQGQVGHAGESFIVVHSNY